LERGHRAQALLAAAAVVLRFLPAHMEAREKAWIGSDAGDLLRSGNLGVRMTKAGRTVRPERIEQGVRSGRLESAPRMTGGNQDFLEAQEERRCREITAVPEVACHPRLPA